MRLRHINDGLKKVNGVDAQKGYAENMTLITVKIESASREMSTVYRPY